jgi:ribose/xylose/arabinose/galactoside ABC-type transport system permease subunit
VPPLLAALGGIGAGVVIGSITGVLVTKLKLTPFIVTLGLLGAVRGLATGLANSTEVYSPNTWLNTLLTSPRGNTKWLIFPIGVWLMLGLSLLVSAILRYTRFGRHIFAIGSNEQTARLCGVNISATKLLIYIFGAGLAGLAGVLQFSELTMGDPTTAKGYELYAIAAAVIGGASLSGGQGSVFGSLMGALLMTTIANGCTKLDLDNWVQDIVTGVIIVLAVVLDRVRQKSSA